MPKYKVFKLQISYYNNWYDLQININNSRACIYMYTCDKLTKWYEKHGDSLCQSDDWAHRQRNDLR